MKDDGSLQTNLTNDITSAFEVEPVWSPDGTKIAFYRMLTDGNGEIYVMNADGSLKVNLTQHPAQDGGYYDGVTFSWSPDGKEIVFHSTRNGNFEIYVVDVNTRQIRRLTNDSAVDRNPIWRPAPVSVSNLPDLAITDIFQDGPYYLKVKYKNIGAAANGDFLIKLSANGKSFGGNPSYRFQVPPPQAEQTTGGFTIGLIGLQQGSVADVTAEIDWEQRVAESNENNNVFIKNIQIQ